MQLEFSFVKEVEEQYYKKLSLWVKGYTQQELEKIVDNLFFDVYTKAKAV